MDTTGSASGLRHSTSHELAPGQCVPPTALKRGGQIPFCTPRNFLNNRFVYAVISQRARGLLIGINLNPDRYCNFDCLYCEVNRDEPVHERQVNLRVLIAELQEMLDTAFKGRLREFPAFQQTPEELLQLKQVAVSGNGEPTLSPIFREAINEVVHIRSKGRFPFFKIVLITNGSFLDQEQVQAGLNFFTREDEIWVKLDAGSQDYMDRVNRAKVTLRKVLSNILLVGRERPVVIQSLFPQIGGEEPSSEVIEQYVQRLQELKTAGAQISLVQVYSAHRPPHRPLCGHLPLKTLSKIAQRVREVTGLKAEVF